MSRTVRRKSFKGLIRDQWTRAYGYDNEWGWIEDRNGDLFLGRRASTADERKKRYLILRTDRDAHPSSMRGVTNSWQRRYEQSRHRQRENVKITRFLRGVTDDVIPGEVQYCPSWFW